MGTSWDLMGLHGVVLFHLAMYPEATMAQISQAVGVTERRVSQVVRDLAEAELLYVTRVGRRNTYRINPSASFRHPTLSHIKLTDFLKILTPPPEEAPVRRRRRRERVSENAG